MESGRFDRWIRSFVAATTRRDTLRALIAGALGAASPVLGRSEAAAACRGPGRPCNKRDQCCSRICAGKKGKRRCRSNSCPTGQCPTGRTCCETPDGSECIDTLNNPSHCGSCDGPTSDCLALIAGGVCLHGACTNVCQNDGQCFGGCKCRAVARNPTVKACASSAVDCSPPRACTDDDDCDAGEGCFVDACPGVGGGVCVATLCVP